MFPPSGSATSSVSDWAQLLFSSVVLHDSHVLLEVGVLELLVLPLILLGLLVVGLHDLVQHGLAAHHVVGRSLEEFGESAGLHLAVHLLESLSAKVSLFQSSLQVSEVLLDLFLLQIDLGGLAEV